ncbi:hypothetical protein JCM19045_773 [Bacillus sp. JCM 19045]|nr:hypothetical protein JCM19045_773 [Bacillus sp. JCM 19045]
MKRTKRWRNGLIAAAVFATMSILVRLVLEGSYSLSDDWPSLIGSSVGAFVAWAFLLPVLDQKLGKKK